jgi:sugar/nucleoside kinase (ribokinase family)
MKTHTCLVVGSMPMDVLARKRVPPAKGSDRFYVHVGHTAGNVATMLAAQYGWRTLPFAQFDDSGWGLRLREDLARYGADVRYVTAAGERGTTLFEETLRPGRKPSRHSRTPGGLAQPSYDLVKPPRAQELLGELSGDPPDVLFFAESTGAVQFLAAGLRARGTFVYFEPPDETSPGALDKGAAVADVVKFSDEDFPDSPFPDGLPGKLVIQTMNSHGLRFNLRGEGWCTLPPVENPDFVDGEGAGDWTSSALLAALGRRGLPRIADLDEATAAECLREAQEMASRSTSYFGSKGILEADGRFRTPPEWLDPAQDPPAPVRPRKQPPPPVDCGRGGTMYSPPTAFGKKTGWTVFLAGPIGGAPYWQKAVPKLAEKIGLEGVTWLNPRARKTDVRWETHGLRACDYVLFWVPPPAAKMTVNDKPYALTTRMELAENLARGKRVVLGIAKGVRFVDHMSFMAKRYGVDVRRSLEDCLRALKREIARRKPAEREIDGPAWVEETLARCVCVDDLARNQAVVERWNREFAPGDTIRVRGGLPVDASLLPLLNGDIRLPGVLRDASVAGCDTPPRHAKDRSRGPEKNFNEYRVNSARPSCIISVCMESGRP